MCKKAICNVLSVGSKEDVDEEEEERISDEISSYEDVIANIADLVGRIVQHHGPPFLPIFQPVLQSEILEFIKPTARIAERYVEYSEPL
jgi:hypothetical protein